MLLGGTDWDETVLGNLIICSKTFQHSLLFKDKQCVHAHGEWKGTLLTVVKTPDIFDLQFLSVTKEMDSLMSLCTPGPTVILLIVKPSNFTEEKRLALKAILTLFGHDGLHHSMVIMTQMQNKLNLNSPMHKLIQDCNQRQHEIKLDRNDLFNNKRRQELMEKIEAMLTDNMTTASDYCLQTVLSQEERNIQMEESSRKITNLDGETKKNEEWPEKDKYMKYVALEIDNEIKREQDDKQQAELQKDYLKYDNLSLSDYALKRKELVKTKEEGQESMKSTECDKIEDLNKKHSKQIADLKHEHSEYIEDLKNKHKEELMYNKNEHSEKIKNLTEDHSKEIMALKQVYEHKIFYLTVNHLEDITQLLQGTIETVAHLKQEQDEEIKNLKQDCESTILDLKQRHDKCIADITHDKK